MMLNASIVAVSHLSCLVDSASQWFPCASTSTCQILRCSVQFFLGRLQQIIPSFVIAPSSYIYQADSVKNSITQQTSLWLGNVNTSHINRLVLPTVVNLRRDDDWVSAVFRKLTEGRRLSLGRLRGLQLSLVEAGNVLKRTGWKQTPAASTSGTHACTPRPRTSRICGNTFSAHENFYNHVMYYHTNLVFESVGKNIDCSVTGTSSA